MPGPQPALDPYRAPRSDVTVRPPPSREPRLGGCAFMLLVWMVCWICDWLAGMAVFQLDVPNARFDKPCLVLWTAEGWLFSGILGVVSAVVALRVRRRSQFWLRVAGVTLLCLAVTLVLFHVLIGSHFRGF